MEERGKDGMLLKKCSWWGTMHPNDCSHSHRLSAPRPAASGPDRLCSPSVVVPRPGFYSSFPQYSINVADFQPNSCFPICFWRIRFIPLGSPRKLPIRNHAFAMSLASRSLSISVQCVFALHELSTSHVASLNFVRASLNLLMHVSAC